jgi:3-dehydroquinate dehydratase-1
MSLLLIRGPERRAHHSEPPPPLPPQILRGLAERAAVAGKTLAVRVCANEAEYLHALDSARRAHTELLLLDPGSAAGSARLHEAVGQTGIPYIEVHDDACDAPEPRLPPSPACLAVAQGYRAQSYTLALEMALEHLGCAECESERHVGT